VEPFSKLGRQLDSAVAAYNDAVGSFDQRVMPQVRRIEQAGAGSGREVDAPPGIEVGARKITARVGAAQDPPAAGAAGEQTALPAMAAGLSADA
jgi:DNA recombination protein RmuC